MNKNFQTVMARKEYQADLEACFGSAWLDVAHGDALLMDDRRDGRGMDGPIDYTDSDYYAEMGFSLEDRIAAQARRDESIDIAMLPCGCADHENGGPADYSARCRR